MSSMKKLTHQQVVWMLDAYRQGDTATTLARRLGVSIQAVNYWLPYVGLSVRWLQYVRNLETKYSRLLIKQKRNELSLSAASYLITRFQPSAKRRSILATALRAKFRLDRKRANRVVGLGESAGESRHASHIDDLLIAMMRRYILLNPGLGFGKMFSVLLRDKPGTRGRALRLYVENKLHLKNRKTPKSRPQVKKRMAVQSSMNQIWSMDFMQDALMTGERFWLLNVIDDCNRESIVLKALKRRSAMAVVEALRDVMDAGRRPLSIRSDNGGEFKSLLYQQWMRKNAVACKYSKPYCPAENAFIELFNKAVRVEVLRPFKFRSLSEVQRSLDEWQLRYNFSRPNLALGDLSPMQFAHCLPRPSFI